jgi:molecular chaperone GrpE (heat shock protein)
VEQFEPQIDTDYKGLEKTAEAVHKRENTDQAHLSGKIAKVVRPGYQYILNDNDVKIVRAAQVKLYL